MYIPKSLFLGLLFAGIGCAVGWMLHGSANDVANAATPAQAMLRSVPASATYPAPVSPPAPPPASAPPPISAPTVPVSSGPPQNIARMVTTGGSNLADIVGRGSLVMGTNGSSTTGGPATATDLFGHPTAVQPFAGVFPPILLEKLFTPLPGATTRGTAIAGWEDHDVNLVGTDIQSTYDDTNIFRNHNGKLNGNTGDTD
ncbi:MAG: hypothetical protein JWL83_725, partial [Actinomycetia bacterium]|nr:hypothetical protein [Actinomycetes bacterium]